MFYGYSCIISTVLNIDYCIFSDTGALSGALDRALRRKNKGNLRNAEVCNFHCIGEDELFKRTVQTPVNLLKKNIYIYIYE